jgi:chromosome segregation ATPase
MKTQFLKDLGIEDKDIITAILAENGRDIEKVKTTQSELETKVSELNEQIKTRDEQLKELKTAAKDNETLTAKIGELEEANKNATTEFETKIANIQKNHAIENGVRDAKAKNIKAVMALLDIDKLTYEDGVVNGLSEQLDGLKADESSSFLFGEVKSEPTPPAGTTPNNPPSNGGNPPTSQSLAEAIANSMRNTK